MIATTVHCDNSNHLHISEAESARCATPVEPTATLHADSPDTAGDRFVAYQTEARALNARIAAALAADGATPYGTSKANWGHVGSMYEVTALLRRISDQMFGEGEHAE